MQIIGLLFNGKLKKKQEIGLIEIKLKREFLGVKGKTKVYALHNNHIDFFKSYEFEIFGTPPAHSQNQGRKSFVRPLAMSLTLNFFALTSFSPTKIAFVKS